MLCKECLTLAIDGRLQCLLLYVAEQNKDSNLDILVQLFYNTHKKMKFFIKDFVSRCDHILKKLRIWSRLEIDFLKKSLMENFMFCAVLPI